MINNLTLELARRLVVALPGEHNPEVIPWVAAGITRGLAAIPDPTPDSRRVYIVLDSPLSAGRPGEPDYLPTFLVGQLARRQRKYLCRTGAIAWWFRNHAAGGRKLKPPGPPQRHWARASTQSLAPLAIDGDLPDHTLTSPDPAGFGDYEWFQLREMPPGGVLYRIDSRRTLTLFQRLPNPSLWAYLRLPAVDAVDVRGIVDQFLAQNGRDLQLPAVHLDIPPMAEVPRRISPRLLPSRTQYRIRRRLAREQD